MPKPTILAGIGIVIAVIIIGIFVAMIYSDDTEVASEQEMNVGTEESGKIIELRLGESASTGDGP